MNKFIVIVANGELDEWIVKDIPAGAFVIGVDRAAYWLIKNNIIPDVAIGDFDSTTTDEYDLIKKKIKKITSFPPEKDFSDTELAVRHAIRLKPKQIIIYGGSGTRLDHTLGTIQLLEVSIRSGIFAVFRNRTNEIVVVGRGRTILEKREGYKYMSVIPITKIIQMTLSGFKYDVSKKIITRGQTIGISNEFAGRQGQVTIHRGVAFIIRSRD